MFRLGVRLLRQMFRVGLMQVVEYQHLFQCVGLKPLRLGPGRPGKDMIGRPTEGSGRGKGQPLDFIPLPLIPLPNLPGLAAFALAFPLA